MKEVVNFVETELHLEISKEKSGIIDPKKGFTFLGYEIKTRRESKQVKCVVGLNADGSKTHAVKRTITEHVHLGVPRERILKFCSLRGYGNYDGGYGNSAGRPAMMHMSDYEIIGQYNAEMRGYANYYNLTPVLYLNKLHWIWENSLYKTLAGKHRMSRTKIARRLPETVYMHVAAVNWVCVADYRRMTARMLQLAEVHYSVCVSQDEFKSWRERAINLLATACHTDCKRAKPADRADYLAMFERLKQRIDSVNPKGALRYPAF